MQTIRLDKRPWDESTEKCELERIEVKRRFGVKRNKKGADKKQCGERNNKNNLFDNMPIFIS